MLFQTGADLMVVGLGNPGTKYQNTRHNVGFLILDKLGDKLGFSADRSKFSGLYTTVSIDGKKVIMVKPQTFMNLSGDCVAAFASYFKIPPEKILVISDDVSMDLGRRRVRRKGSAGGHNGLKDIAKKIGSENYPRIKIGVGQKPHPDYDMADWVLSSFTEKEKEEILSHTDACLGIIKEILKGDIDAAMSRYNR